MSEGGISKWKVSDGSTFSAGEVLLEIETDKATIDVEAQEDGVMGKIITGDGTKNVQVGQLIALLAEEGDDIDNLEVPKASQASSNSAEQSEPQSPSPTSPSTSTSSTTQAKQSISQSQPQQPIKFDHSKPIFPSVMRLLHENGISPDKVKGTGIRGMLTKGDVLAFMGKASSPTGTWKAVKESPIPKSIHKPVPKELTPGEVRRLMVEGIAELHRKQHPAPSLPPVTYESILASYVPGQSHTPAPSTVAPLSPPKPTPGYLDGLI